MILKSSDANQLWDRLRRRKLIQWSVAYLAAAWALLQVLEFLAQQFGWSAVIVRGATVFLAIGFLAAFVLAWYHGERGAQRVTAVEVVLLLVILLGGSVAAVIIAPADEVTATSPASATAAAEQGSIAVLPFVNMSDSKDNEYFSDGITEEILNALAGVDGLRVASRTSAFQFKGQQVDVGDVARKLNVASVLEGSVRKAGDRIRITAQLINASSGYHMWSETYDRELKDIFAVQEEIARAITKALSVKLVDGGAGPLVRSGTDDIEAYNLYLRANYHANNYTKADLERALELFDGAIARDSNFAIAYADKANALASMADDWLAPKDAYPLALAAARRAVALDSESAVAHRELGLALLLYHWNGREAKSAFERAVSLNPNLSSAWEALGLIATFDGNAVESERLLKRASVLDPLSSSPVNNIGRLYLAQRRWDDAIRAGQSLLDSNPRYVMAYRLLGDAYLGKGDAQRALDAFNKGLELDPGLARLRTGEMRALTAVGRQAEARRKLSALEQEAEQRYIRGEEVAQAWAALGDNDRAFHWLERALSERSAGLLFLRVWPAYDPLRSDPRFASLVNRVWPL